MNTNKNHLEGLACPKCGGHTQLLITGSAVFKVFHFGISGFSDVEYDSNSPTACSSWGCDFAGDLGEFRKENQ